jgi:sugar phosphate permease
MRLLDREMRWPLRRQTVILVAYLMAYMDRVNVSFAALQMNDDLIFSASIYGLGAGLFFLAYATFGVPSSLMLRRYSAPQWIARIMFTHEPKRENPRQFPAGGLYLL